MTNEELAVQAKQGDRDATVQLWEQCRRFCLKIAQHYLPTDGSSTIEMDDLLSSSYFALLSAVDAYDPDSGFTFLTYLSRHLKNAFAQVRGWHGRKELLDSARSLDAPLTEDGDTALTDVLPDPTAEDAFTAIDNRLQAAPIFKELNRLPDAQRRAITYRINGATNPRTAAAMALTPAETQNLYTKGLSKLRRTRAAKELAKDINQHTAWYLHIGIQSQQVTGSSVEALAERREQYNDQRLQHELDALRAIFG